MWRLSVHQDRYCANLSRATTPAPIHVMRGTAIACAGRLSALQGGACAHSWCDAQQRTRTQARSRACAAYYRLRRPPERAVGRARAAGAPHGGGRLPGRGRARARGVRHVAPGPAGARVWADAPAPGRPAGRVHQPPAPPPRGQAPQGAHGRLVVVAVRVHRSLYRLEYEACPAHGMLSACVGVEVSACMCCACAAAGW